MKHPNRLYFCVKDFARFGTTPFPLSEERASSCSGVIHKMTTFLWEVESPSTFRDSHWLTDSPSDKVTGKTMRTFLRWRLRRYLKDEKAEVMVRKSPFDASTWLFKQEKPCWADPGPAADQLRTRLMRAMHELNHYHPTLAATVTEYFKKVEDPYTPALLESAFKGEERYGYDRSIYGDPAPENKAETVVKLVTALSDETEPSPAAIEQKLAEDCDLNKDAVAEPEPEEVAKRLAEDCEKAGTLQVQGHSEMSGA